MGKYVIQSHQRARTDIDLHAEKYKKYWLRELPEDLAALVDVSRFGPGERIVSEPYTREMYDTTQHWMDAHDLIDLAGTTSGYADVILT